MASKCHNNAIITGYLDSFCLACGCFLRSEQEICTHIEKPLHRKNLDLVPYLEKFKGDRIRKVEWGYYCEFCNALFAIASKVNVHVTEDSHKHSKGALLLKLAGSDVVAFDDVIIKARSWHGIIDNMCTVCNTEFEDECLHRSHNKHLLNLVQKPVQFGANNAIFRRVDDNVIQCLTCEHVIASNTMNQHFNDSEHLSIYDKCRHVKSAALKNKENTLSGKNDSNAPNTKKIKDKPIENESLLKDTKSKIIESISKYQNNMININLETETASCKKCLVNISFDSKDIEHHIADHSTSIEGNVDSELLYPSHFDRNLNKIDVKEPVTEDSSSIDADKKVILQNLPDIPEQPQLLDEHNSPVGTINDNESTSKENTVEDIDNFAKSNNITINKDQHKAYCHICKKIMPSTLTNLKEHVTGTMHKKNVQMAPKPKPLLKKPMKMFVNSKYDVTSVIFADATVINEKYYVNRLSYSMITKTDSGLRCQACEVTLSPSDDDGLVHAECLSHKRILAKTQVIMNFSSEFIREVRAGVFHCGYCNLVVGNRCELEMHLQCSEHEEKKKYSAWHLNNVSHMIAIHKRREANAEQLMLMVQKHLLISLRNEMQ